MTESNLLTQAATRLVRQSLRTTELVQIVNQSTANRALFHLRTVDKIPASFANRDQGADRNAWLYSYNC